MNEVSKAENKPAVSVIIATRNRPNDLRDCLFSLKAQSLQPVEVIVVDGSDDDRTFALVSENHDAFNKRLRYYRETQPSAARQRNLGAAVAEGDYVCFLDDDVILETEFLEEVCKPFISEIGHLIGGVSGTITNQNYTRPSTLNRSLLRLCAGPEGSSYGGRLVGPAVNFYPEDGKVLNQEVEWLLSGCVAYPREIFLQYQFPQTFDGYSIAEDVFLSARIGRRFKLVNTTRARLYHKDLGGKTHNNWFVLGRNTILNRHAVMAYVLKRTRLRDYFMLVSFELFYSTLALLWNAGGPHRIKVAVAMLRGRLVGLAQILKGKSPHRNLVR